MSVCPSAQLSFRGHKLFTRNIRVKAEQEARVRGSVALPQSAGFLLPKQEQNQVTVYGDGFSLNRALTGRQRAGLITYHRPRPPVPAGFQEARIVMYTQREGFTTSTYIMVYCEPVETGTPFVRGLLAPPATAGALPWPSIDAEPLQWKGEAEEGKLVVSQQASPRRTLAIQYTCNRCGTRNVNQVNPNAWHNGTIFIECGGCHARHKLVDNLEIVQEMQLGAFQEQMEDARKRKLRSVMPESMTPR